MLQLILNKINSRKIYLLRSFLLSILFSLLLIVSAQIKIYTGFSPIPITMQTFIVLLAGVLLREYFSIFAILIYLILGNLGLPIFAGSIGINSIFGITGGYLIGFLLAVFFIGKSIKNIKNSFLLFSVLLFANYILIYIPGLMQLYVFTHMSIKQLFLTGFYPFIVGDFIKLLLVFLIVKQRITK